MTNNTEHVPTLPRVTELFDTLKSAHEELAQIRKACPHPSYFVGWWEWRLGCVVAARICDRCRSSIEGITDEERAALEPLFPPMEGMPDGWCRIRVNSNPEVPE